MASSEEQAASEARAMREQVERMLRLVYGNWQTCVTYAFAELGLADLLQESARSVAWLAAATRTDAAALRRFLRCAAGLGFIAGSPAGNGDGDGDGKDAGNGGPGGGNDAGGGGGEEGYRLTAFGALLGSDHPRSQRSAARLNGAPYRYEPWGRLLEVLAAGHCRGVSPTAEGTLDYLADKPELRRVFHRAMAELSAGEDEPIARAYDFSGFRHVVDVGCGEGGLVRAILRQNPHLRGTMFDRDAGGPAEDGGGPLAGRLSRQAGDFFAAVPDHGDLYTMKNVVHNWPEDAALRLLRNVRAAMLSPAGAPPPPGGKRLLLIEHLVEEGDGMSVAKWLDLNFMVLVSGAERTLDEYRALARRAGFDLRRAIPTPAGRHILELAPTPSSET